MLLDKIKNYEIFRPKCGYTKEILHALATFDARIMSYQSLWAER